MADNKIEIELVDKGGADKPSAGAAGTNRIEKANADFLAKMFDIDLSSAPTGNRPRFGAQMPGKDAKFGDWRDIDKKNKVVVDDNKEGPVNKFMTKFGKVLDLPGLANLKPLGEAAATAETSLGSFSKMLGKTGTALGIIGVAVGVATLITKGWENAVMTSAANMGGGGNRGKGYRIAQLNAEQADLEGYFQSAGSFGIYDLSKHISRVKQRAYDESTKPFQEASERLGQYSPDLARTLAQRQVATQRRDIDESRILGPALAETQRRQQQLDLVQQQIEAAKMMKDAAKLNEATQNRVEVAMDDLQDAMKGLTEAQKKAIRDMGKEANDPVRQILNMKHFGRPKNERVGPRFHADQRAPINVRGLMGG